eukprot:COSAG01_NODE_32338_length_583_cov_0.640496_1_plen_97_part_10
MLNYDAEQVSQKQFKQARAEAQLAISCRGVCLAGVAAKAKEEEGAAVTLLSLPATPAGALPTLSALADEGSVALSYFEGKARKPKELHLGCPMGNSH